MRTLRGLPAALGASAALIAAAPALLLVLAAIVGLNEWHGHHSSHVRTAKLELRQTPRPVVVAARATPTAAPVRLAAASRSRTASSRTHATSTSRRASHAQRTAARHQAPRGPGAPH